MTDNPSGILARITEESLRKCLLRLAKTSAGTWEILSARVSRGTIAEALKHHDFKNPNAAAVYFSLSGLPLTAMMMFDPLDMECISKCFMGYSFPRGPVTTPTEEVMLLELGNIVLNSLINSAMNALKKSGMPSVPVYLEGEFPRLLEGLKAGVDPAKSFHIVALTLALRSDKSVAMSEVLALVPDELALELESLPRP